MNLAYKKILGKFTKVLGFGKTPPHVGKISQIISFFLFESVPNNHVWIKKSCVQKCERSFNQSDSYREGIILSSHILFEMVPASCFFILVPRANAARISARLLGHHQ